jgi:hypothetical protein
MTDIAAARSALLRRVLDGDGEASHAQRRAAFEGTSAAGPVRALLEKIARCAHRVSDEEVRSARAAGLSEDQLFELAVCAALGQASRQYEAALAALARASAEE